MLKKSLSKFVRGIFRAIMHFPRKSYYKKKIKKLTNSNFSIISSDCFGSYVYHNLNQRFDSPTINLFFSQDDFIQFVSHLKEYLAEELVERKGPNQSYPVGELTYDGQTIKVHFMHYHSFKEAKAKWDERKTRINYSNIYIVQTVSSNLTQEHVDKFSALPYKHKMLIAHRNNCKGDCIVSHDIFSTPNFKPAKFLNHKTLVSLDRYMDDIDYVGWLNNQ